MALFKVALLLVLVAACTGEWTKCKPSPEYLTFATECIKSELGKDVVGKEGMKELHKTSTEEEMQKVAVCVMKKKGVLNDKNEYLEAKAIQCAEELETTPEIKAKLVEGIKTCGKGLNHNLKEDQVKIFKCSKDVMKKECM